MESLRLASEALSRQIGPALARRYGEDAAFRRRARSYAVEALGWTFFGRPSDLERLARLSALALLADLGYYAALRRHYPSLPDLKALAATEAPEAAIERALALAGTLPEAPTSPPALGHSCPSGHWPLSDGERPRGAVSSGLLREIALGSVGEGEQRRLLGEGAQHDIGLSPADGIGPLWEALAPTAERRQAGQFYSAADPIDLILSFCVRSAGETVLDPACGSGAFLVRALARLGTLAPDVPAASLARRLHGVDLDGQALILTKHNVAARSGAAPHLRRGDFLALDATMFPAAGAVVGNPPYTRQELLDDRDQGLKGAARRTVAAEWGQRVSGRAGLHLPFLLHAAAFLAPGGRLGMLTSNSWLNAGYGAALRRFLLERCRIVAVVAPGGERWFSAAVNAVALIAEREDDAGARLAHRARFVRLKRPLAELIGDVAEPERWRALEQLVARIAAVEESAEDGEMRVIALEQDRLAGGGDLTRWPPSLLERFAIGSRREPGNVAPTVTAYQSSQTAPVVCRRWTDVLGGEALAGRGGARPAEGSPPTSQYSCDRALDKGERTGVASLDGDAVAVAKWAVYLGAPRSYFALMERAGDRLCVLGGLATVWRGLTTGCNGFFYVRDVTGSVDGRTLVALGIDGDQLGALAVVEAGDGSRHAVERRYLRPVVTSPREVLGLAVERARLRYYAVLLPAERAALAGTRAAGYIAWGEQAVAGKGRGLLPAASRVTCAGRRSWWSLDGHAGGKILWSKTHYARHLAPLNPEGFLADCNLYYVAPHPDVDAGLLAATLNSTLVALQKELHGRANLGEGALKTEVSDLLALPVPDPRRFAVEGAARLRRAWATLQGRPVGDLVAEMARADRQELDEALLAALGGGNRPRWGAERERLYEAIAGLLGERLGSRRGTSAAASPRGREAAALAAAVLGELRERGDGEAGAEGIGAILAGFTPDRKLRAAALRLVGAELGIAASDLPSMSRSRP